jgi:hypothetical protein
MLAPKAAAEGLPPGTEEMTMTDHDFEGALVPRITSDQYDVETLIRDFGDSFSRDTILKVFGQATEELKDARFRKYVSLFAYRFARERLATVRAALLDGDDLAYASASGLTASAAQSGGHRGT